MSQGGYCLEAVCQVDVPQKVTLSGSSPRTLPLGDFPVSLGLQSHQRGLCGERSVSKLPQIVGRIHLGATGRRPLCPLHRPLTLGILFLQGQRADGHPLGPGLPSLLGNSEDDEDNTGASSTAGALTEQRPGRQGAGVTGGHPGGCSHRPTSVKCPLRGLSGGWEGMVVDASLHALADSRQLKITSSFTFPSACWSPP